MLNARGTLVDKRNTILLPSCLESKGKTNNVYNRMQLARGVNKDVKL